MSRSPYYHHYPPAAHAAPHHYLGMSHANTPVLVISRPMPQQPMPQLRRARPPKPLRSPDRRKRYGVVFTTDPLRGMLAEEDDDDSTWSMSRARASWRMQRGARYTSAARTRNSSPAQEIIARYRASHTDDDDDGHVTSNSSVTFVDGYPPGRRPRTTSNDTSMSSTSGPRLRYRNSRVNAMDHATKEAYLMAVQCGGYRNIPCQRPGCRAILPTIRDLASHLAIHDIDPRNGYGIPPRYTSFVDMGHSVEGRARRRPPMRPTPAPYARSHHTRSKFRRYLSKLTYPCAPCFAYDHYDDFDFL